MSHRNDSPAAFAARVWLAFGLLLVVMVPGARESHAAIGWLPIWLVIAPAAAWCVLARSPLVGMRVLVPLRRARRRAQAVRYR